MLNDDQITKAKQLLGAHTGQVPEDGEPVVEGHDLLAAGINPAPELMADPVAVNGRTPTTPLHQWTDKLFVHLGAVYEICNLADDLLQQFCSEHKFERSDVQDLVLGYQLVEGLADWGNVLQAVPVSWGDKLNLWLLNQCFVRRGTDRSLKLWWRPRRLIQKVIAGSGVNPPVSVDFYLPFGNVGRTDIATADQGTLTVVFNAGIAPPKHTVPEQFLWQTKLGR